MKRAAWFALLAGPAMALPASTAVARTTPGFVPPGQPMVLTRTLERALADGKRIVTRRSWELSFRRTADGYVVDGALLDSQVEAPPALAALAQIERTRSDGTLFPLLLDASGMIQPPAPAANTVPVVAARESAARIITAASMAPAERGQAQSLLAAVAAAALHTASSWPTDLFVPRQVHREDRREIATATGESGSIAVVTEMRVGAAGALLEHASRQVVTQVGGDRRTSEEQWALVPRAQFTIR